MSEHSSGSPLPDIQPLYRLIRTTRSLLRSSWVATGLGLTVGLWFGALAAVALADLLVPLWPVFRLTGLLLVVVPAVWAFIVGVVRPLFRRLRPGQVARRIEKHIPGIHNRLVSCIDLAENQQPTHSPAFYRRLLTEALERIKGFRARTVIDFLSLRKAGVFAFASLAAFGLAFVLFSDRLPTAMARIFAPFADIPPASGVVFTVTPAENAKVLRGEDLVFRVKVEKGEARDFRVKLSSDQAEKPVWHDLKKVEDNLWQVAVNSGSIGAGFEHRFQFRVYGGGTWSKQYQVAVLDRPALLDLHTVLHYPEYMGIGEPKVGPPQIADVTGPEESQVEVVVQAEGAVQEGEIQFLASRIGRIEPNNQMERVWFQDQIPPGARADGTWQWEQRKGGRPAHTEPPAVGAHGHWFEAVSEKWPVQAGEHLFTYVYIDAANPPEALMLEWHDGTGWEHRAFWGQDKFKEGKTDSPSRRRLGPLPAAGKWVRLEVPAELVGLSGHMIHGLGFKLYGGRCYWSGSGTLRVEEPRLVPVQTFAMRATEGNQWSGKFPLRGTGLYRVELRNELGYANKPMKEARFVAIPDNPPQIVLERPGADMTLSAPAKVPLVVAAFDDFGLGEVSLAIQRGDKGPWETRVVKRYAKPQAADSIVTNLDLPALNGKTGETVRYYAEAKDRKGQVARTPDFLVRITADPSAADRQLADLEKSQDPFRQKLLNLIAQQAKVRDKVEKLNAQYATLDEKLKVAESNIKPAETKDPKATPPQPATPSQTLKLDPETEKMLQALKQELAELAKQEEANLQLGRQIDGDLGRIADQANKTQMLPKEIADQLQALQQLFQQRAVNPLQSLTNDMKRGAEPRQVGNPDLKGMQQTSNRLQKELEAMKERMQALEDAQKNLRGDAADAIAKLKNDMLKQQGALTERDLEDLKNFIAALRDELNQQKGHQEDLQKAADNAPEAQLPDVEKKQAGLDKKIDEALDKTKELQASEKMKRLKRQPEFPGRPYDPETGEQKVRPKEEDPDEPDAANKDKQDAGKTGNKTAKDKKGDDEEENLFMPALGGPKPKVDPRFANKQRPVKKNAKNGEKSAAEQREDLQAHQEDKLNDLNRADQSLASDQQSLEQMLNQFRRALQQGRQAKQPSGQPSPGNPQGQSQDLAQMLKSQALQQALDMANRMRGMQQGARRPGQPNTPQNQTAISGNLQGSPPPGFALDGELGKLDLEMRKALLKLPPKVREELLQSRSEKGPEGYQEFIDDYFKRLSQGKGPK
jgi:hypothetical protein